MATKTFYLPDLGEGLPDAEIVEWHVREGDTVKLDQPLVSMETAKAVVEVPSPYTGTVAKLHGKATIARWMAWARAGATAELAADLLDVHYDPSYTRAIRRNFPLLRHAEVIRVQDAADVTFRDLARRLLADDSPKTIAA